MSLPTIRQALATLALGLGLTATAPARADLIVNTPTGLNPGDQFRIAFITSGTRDATSSLIADYNTFVNNDAITQAGGGANVVRYDTTVLNFSAWISTANVNAVANIGTFNVPVYLANGTLVTPSDGATGLLSGSLTNSISRNLSGNTINNLVWTGTLADGTVSGGSAAGNSSATIGNPTFTNSIWTNMSNDDTNYNYTVYGFSQLLTVPTIAGVPEPGTLVGAALGCGLALLAGARRRRAHAA